MTKFYHRHDHDCETPVKGVHSIKADRGLVTLLATCGRCGGAGGHEQWRHTGWTCYDCGGTGNKGHRDHKVYTAEKIVKLDEAKGKAAAKREAKIKAKRDATIDAFRADHPELIAGMIEVKDHNGIIANMLGTIEERGTLSEKQIDFAGSLVMEARDTIATELAAAKEKARRVRESRHLDGEVGDRLVIKAVIDGKLSGPGGFNNDGWHMTKLMADDGSLVIYWGWMSPADEDGICVYPDVGDTIEFKATIKEFSERDGEKQTIVNRPHIINYELTGEENSD